ncbi:MAG: nitroreductase [Alphaproteobacteria bacterium]|nr:nitroreductase [Alphaproteobacteria bacterium]
MSNLIAAKPSAEILDYLLRRRSVKLDLMTAPGPEPAQIENILRAASRVPDHGRMCPWYFLIFEGDARAKAGEIFQAIYLQKNPEADPAQLDKEAKRFLRAPLVIAMISRTRKGKNPLWEQILSAGAAGMNLSLAAHAQGFGVNWLTEWIAYDADVKAALGLDARDHVAGFFYIGSIQGQPEERDRPDLSSIVTHWHPDVKINKGDLHDQEKMGFPPVGFKSAFLDEP